MSTIGLPTREEVIAVVNEFVGKLTKLGINNDEILRMLVEVLESQKGGNEKSEESQNQIELPPLIVEYCEGFVKKMEGIEKKQEMVDLFKNLYRDGKLHIDENVLGKIVKLDGLGYEFLILDLGKYNKEHPLNPVCESCKDYSSNFFKGYKASEANIKGLGVIENILGWIDYCVPNEEDMRLILEKISSQNDDVIKNIEKNGEFHDEDIAFFMLFTQSYGEFLLKNGKVFKCYDKFRGFKEVREKQSGQILLIKKVGEN